MLDTRFPRILGDVGNIKTWPFPVLYGVVSGASPVQVIQHNGDGLLGPFLDVAQELVRKGAMGLTTSCGLLAHFQTVISKVAGVPVASSCLMQVPWVQSLLPPNTRVGILTISNSQLIAEQLRILGMPSNTPIIGMDPKGAFARAVIHDEIKLDVDQSRAEIVFAAGLLCSQNPNIRALVLECTNMAPYTADVSEALNLPVFDFYSFITWFQAGLCPRRF